MELGPGAGGGRPSTGSADEDVTVEMAYNVDGQVSTLTAKNSTTGDQVTTYVYGTDVGGITPEVYRNDLLQAEIYPDSDDTTSLGDGVDGIYDRVEFKYNRQGQVIWKKDQNGTVHEFDYDSLGRPMADKVTTVGTGVDDAVLRIAKSYEVRGMVDKLTSYDAATDGSTVNQVVLEYDDTSLLDKEYQEHAGLKDGSTPYVQYNRDTSASGGQFTKGLRPASLRYPNGRLVHNTYGSSGSTEDAINRIAAIKDDSAGSPGTSLAEYQYLGQGAIVQVDYPEPELRYDLAHGAGDDPYDGMDRFGRVVDLFWRDYGSSSDAVRIQHGYDRAGNRLYREDPVAAANGKDFDELYSYDGVNQLKTFQRGNLNGSKDGLVAASMTFAHDWGLDPTGNWSTFKEDDDGDSTWDLSQSRTSNKANELTNITETAGPAWLTPVYNRAGNMTTIPKPADPTAGYTATYDAWNRLVKIEEGENTLAEYEYDGRTFRTVKRTYDAGDLDETRHFYYNSGWQCLEERVDTSTDPDRRFIWGQRYMDDLILRDRDTSNPKNGTLDERLYSLQDPNWNVIALAATNGTIQERYAYTAYGTPKYLTPTWGARGSSNYDWEILYAGYRFDGETEMYQVRNRVLRPGLGWVQRDPIGILEDMASYRYVRNNPVEFLDPLGLWLSLGDDLWMSDRSEDDFEGLVKEVNPQLDPKKNTLCIVPQVDAMPSVVLGEAEKAWSRQSHRPVECGVYNTGNLTDSWTNGGKGTASLGVDKNNYIAPATTFYGAVWFPSTESFVDALRTKSGSGGKPLSGFTLIGHGLSRGEAVGGEVFGDPRSAWFRVQSLGVQQGRVKWEHARNRILPPICWFRTDAEVRFVGCNTSGFAKNFAKKWLRLNAIAWGTTIMTWAIGDGKMGWGDRRGAREELGVASSPEEYHTGVKNREHWLGWGAGGDSLVVGDD